MKVTFELVLVLPQSECTNCIKFVSLSPEWYGLSLIDMSSKCPSWKELQCLLDVSPLEKVWAAVVQCRDFSWTSCQTFSWKLDNRKKALAALIGRSCSRTSWRGNKLWVHWIKCNEVEDEATLSGCHSINRTKWKQQSQAQKPNLCYTEKHGRPGFSRFDPSNPTSILVGAFSRFNPYNPTSILVSRRDL
jgi:hypothetical protein